MYIYMHVCMYKDHSNMLFNLSSENNLLMFQLNAPVVNRVKVTGEFG